MPFQFHENFKPGDLKNTGYGFFTNENGSSAGGYVINGEKTRNVNLASPQEEGKEGYDPASSIIENLMSCFKELTSGQENDAKTHKFVMTSNYAAGGARVLTCKTLDELKALKDLATSELLSLKLHENIQSELHNNNVHVLKADAMVFKGISGELIAAGGGSGDAHPIVLIDDENKVSAYIAGAHAALKESVIEKTIQAMLAAGAQQKNIHLLIGPGLGSRSYEFGSNAADYLNLPKDKITFVKNNAGETKCLFDIESIVAFKAMGFIAPENIHNMCIDTMGFDLYGGNGTRKSSVNCTELSRQGPLFFSARRDVMKKEGIDAQNSGLHNTTGRHFAGITIKG